MRPLTIAVLLAGCGPPDVVVERVDNPAEAARRVTATVLGEVACLDGEHPATPDFLKCNVYDGVLMVFQVHSTPVPATLPEWGWCGEPGAPDAVAFRIHREPPPSRRALDLLGRIVSATW